MIQKQNQQNIHESGHDEENYKNVFFSVIHNSNQLVGNRQQNKNNDLQSKFHYQCLQVLKDRSTSFPQKIHKN